MIKIKLKHMTSHEECGTSKREQFITEVNLNIGIENIVRIFDYLTSILKYYLPMF